MKSIEKSNKLKIKKEFNRSVKKTGVLTVFSFLMLASSSMAQIGGGNESKIKNRSNHITIEAGTGIGKLEDSQLTNAEITYNSLSLRLGYEYHLKNDFRFQLHLNNESTLLKPESEKRGVPYVAFESRIGFLAPVVNTEGGFKMHLGSNYGFSTRFANWVNSSQFSGNFSSITSHNLNAAVHLEYTKNKWRTSLGLNMPLVSHVYRSNDPSTTITGGNLSKLFTNGEWTSINKYQVPEIALSVGYNVTNFLELSLNYNFKATNNNLGAEIRQLENQVRLAAMISF
ncbi:hypothetical protein [Brumimicrobium mesophilum]|uniref:hypothetical protein n=1 Tax=Brumimicrobium mesophilum TaxID=392717 RepID=UPI000D1445EC|nr:hypothetical protein [Brumimicrobium mesophilum]